MVVNMERRQSDTKLIELAEDVSTLKQQVEENTALTKEIKVFLDDLAALKKFGKWAKIVATWVTAIAGAYIAVKATLLGQR